MTTVTITDEGARRALETALWYCADSAIPENEPSDALWGAGVARARAVEDELAACRTVVAETAQALASVLRMVDTVRAADIGATVVLDVEASDLRVALGYCKGSVEEFEEFWQASPEARERMIATRDGAARILSTLPSVEAVA